MAHLNNLHSPFNIRLAALTIHRHRPVNSRHKQPIFHLQIHPLSHRTRINPRTPHMDPLDREDTHQPLTPSMVNPCSDSENFSCIPKITRVTNVATQGTNPLGSVDRVTIQVIPVVKIGTNTQNLFRVRWRSALNRPIRSFHLIINGRSDILRHRHKARFLK